MLTLTDCIDRVAVLDNQFFGEQAQIFDGLKTARITASSFIDVILEIVVKDVAVGDTQQMAHELSPSNIGTSWMQARVRLWTNEAESDQSENMLRISGIADRSSENGSGFRDTVMFDVIERIAISETFKREAGQEVQHFRFLQQGATRRNLHNLPEAIVMS